MRLFNGNQHDFATRNDKLIANLFIFLFWSNLNTQLEQVSFKEINVVLYRRIMLNS